MSRLSTSIPSRVIAGDSFAASASSPDCPAGDGWGATLLLVGPDGQHRVAGAIEGDGFRFAANYSATSGWVPGSYTAHVQFTRDDERKTLPAGELVIQPDPASATAREQLSPWRRILADLEAAYEAHVAAGRSTVQSYTINGRSMTFKDAGALLKEIENARGEVARENAAERIAQGRMPRTRFVVRFR